MRRDATQRAGVPTATRDVTAETPDRRQSRSERRAVYLADGTPSFHIIFTLYSNFELPALGDSVRNRLAFHIHFIFFFIFQIS